MGGGNRFICMRYTKASQLWNRIVSRLAYPFREDLLFFLLVWLMLAVPECAVQVAKGNWLYSLLFFLLYFGVTYVILLIVDFAKWTRATLKPVFFIFLAILTGVNLFCLKTYHTRLNYDIIEIIAATNPGEVREYFRMYIGWKEYGIIFLYFLVCVGAYIACIKFKVKRYKLSWTVVGVLLIMSIASYWINPAVSDSLENWTFSYDDIADISKYPTHPQLAETDSIHPLNVVLIIGESFAPSHSSLYGYSKHTNPWLEALRDSGRLAVFSRVVSPATSTSAAFKLILNTLKKGEEKEKKWYESTSLLEVLNTAGYSTHWLSNQAELGLYNNLSSSQSKLCDHAVFIREYWDQSLYDGQLIEETPRNLQGKNAFVYHLIGQHPYFAERYPADFERFKPEDYPEIKGKPEKLSNIAAYDNATLYNDYVVSEIIRLFSGEDAVVFYFSDHGFDVYESDPDYCSHAKSEPASQTVGVKIPFMVYMSPEFEKNHPSTAERIINSVGKPYSTDLLIYSVMDAAGYRFGDSDDVETLSLFKGPGQ